MSTKQKKFHSSTILNYSPRKTRLIINPIRGQNLKSAMTSLMFANKPKAKKIYNLLKSAYTGLGLTESDLADYNISTIVAEEAQTYYRMIPRARGSSAKIRRRYSRIKVSLNKAELDNKLKNKTV
jgi:large subunit ribosomal protein L22